MSDYDYIVVGAGSAGVPLAARLAADGTRRVLLIEAGPPATRTEIRIPAAFTSLFGSDVDWGHRTVPQPGLAGREIILPQGRVVGGSSAINAMMWVPGVPADFDEWPWGWASVAPILERVEQTQSVQPLSWASPLTAAFLEA
jgi:choline dehydrogenase